MVNTPATWSIYIAGPGVRMAAAAGRPRRRSRRRNIEKAALLYDYLDATPFYTNPVRREDRSRMNVPFKLRRRERSTRRSSRARRKRGMVQLKGHRSVGGMRASIYNAMPIEGVRTLVAYMKEFERRHG